MSAQRRYGLRPMLPSDVAALREIFRASVLELTEDDYSPGQQAAWADTADDAAAFTDRLAGQLTLVATAGDDLVGFVSLRAPDKLDMLYVHPLVARQGVASLLYSALEKLATARQVAALEVDASDTARGFFTRQGFRPERRNSVRLGGEWLSNTTMRKPFLRSVKP